MNRLKCLELGFDLDAFLAIPESGMHDYRQPTNVYLLRCLSFVKIGVAVDVSERVAALKIGNPLPIHTLMVMPFPSRTEAMMVERTVHSVLAAHHHESEWFTCRVALARSVLKLVSRAMPLLAARHVTQKADRREKAISRYDTDAKYRARVDRRENLARERVNAYRLQEGMEPIQGSASNA